MGTCLSRCYPETNTSTNGFSSSTKGNERTIKCEYRRIFKGHRNEDSKKWSSSSTPKRQKYTSAEIPSHLCHSVHTDRCLPNVPTELLICKNTEHGFVMNSQVNVPLHRKDQKCHLGPVDLNGDVRTSGDEKYLTSSAESPEKNYFIPGSNDSADINNSIKELFEKYYETDQDSILADGIERFCNDLCLQPDDFRVLLLAWHFEAETMCRFTRKEFFRGFRKLKVDSLQSLRSKIFAGCACKKCSASKQDEILDKCDAEDEKGTDDNDQLYGRIYPSHEDGPFVTEITANREAFRSVYRWSYRFALDMETGQRTLPLDMAMSMWQLVFSKRLLFFEKHLGHLDLITSPERRLFGDSQEGLSNSQGILASFEDTSGKEVSKDVPLCLTSQSTLNLTKNDSTDYQFADENTNIMANLHHALPLIRSWFQFLNSLKGSLRGITRDTWDMFFTFIESVGDNGSGYNDTEAWPSLFDDFIEWLKDQNPQ